MFMYMYLYPSQINASFPEPKEDRSTIFPQPNPTYKPRKMFFFPDKDLCSREHIFFTSVYLEQQIEVQWNYCCVIRNHGGGVPFKPGVAVFSLGVFPMGMCQ